MIKLNADLGEIDNGHNHDAQLMPYLDQANIACGFHASTPLLMQQTVKLAIKHQVTIGAHPSYPDKENFGRTSMQLSNDNLIACLHYQIGALQTICHALHASVEYVKPHGALYNDMMVNLDIFASVCQAISLLSTDLPLMIQALPDDAPYRKIANQYGISLWFEGFADRAYQDNGLLVSRAQQGAVLNDTQQVLRQVQQLYRHHQLTTINQQTLTLKVDTLCVHGDNLAAIQLVQAIRHWLDEQT